jgi:hypothetical protein
MDNAIAETVKENGKIAGDIARTSPPRLAKIQHIGPYASCYAGTRGVLDARIRGSTWTNVKPEIDGPDRHELFLLADGERKVEMETVTRKLRPYSSRIQVQGFLTPVRRGRKRRSLHFQQGRSHPRQHAP